MEMEGLEDLIPKIEKIAKGAQSSDKKLKDIAKLLKDNVDYYNWVGFYIADPNRSELVLGPYAGDPTIHKRIPFGSGICGQAIMRKNTYYAPDVSKESNYLSCSPLVRSEIVLPIFKGEVVVAELDIDSNKMNPFTKKDREVLEHVCEIISPLF
jgi:L-methionine (R)-S-oxide reductase